MPGSIGYKYQDISAPDTQRAFDNLLRSRDYDVFCLNDTDSDPSAFARQMVSMGDFLAEYFPVRSPFELP